MFSPFLRRILIDICLVVAFVLGAFYFYSVFIDFLISLFHFDDKLNISSLVYCIQRFVIVLLPLIMLTTKLPGGKNKILKTLFYIIGICYFLANAWIFSFMKDNSILDVFKASVPVWFSKGDLQPIVETAYSNCFQFQYQQAYVFNYLVWDTYDFWGIIFSTVMGILYIDLARNIDGRKNLIIKKYLIILILTVAFPQLYNMLIQGKLMFSNEWGLRNMLLIFEMVFVFISLKMASSARPFWSDILY